MRTIGGWLRLLAAAALLVVVVAACGDDDERGGGTNPTVEGTTTSASTASSTTSEATTTSSGPPAGVRPLAEVRARLVEVARLRAPIALTTRGDEPNLYVAERGGRVLRLRPEGDGYAVDDEPVLDLTGRTTPSGEQGLLGIAFSSNGDTLFASYTDLSGDTRLVAYPMLDDGRADRDNSRVVLAQAQPYANHNGGNVILGPDGMLWFGLGDGGSAGDPENRAQDDEDLLGKIMRIDPEGGQPEIMVKGVRNPWRFSFDPANDDLWVADVGQYSIEEIDHLPAGTIEGTNLGWSAFEGSERYDRSREAVGGHLVGPVFEVSHDDGWCSITGGVVVRAESLAPLHGAYLFSDYCKGGVHALRLEGGQVSETAVVVDETDGQVASINSGPGGEVFVLSLNGSVSRLQT